jgi:hypothetical protein
MRESGPLLASPVLISPAIAAHALPRSRFYASGECISPANENHIVSQFASPSACRTRRMASVLTLRLFFSAGAKVKEKNQSSKEAQEKTS